MEGVIRDLLLSGHTLLDYQHMFDLTDADLSKSFLTVASGFDTFNTEMTTQGNHVISCARNYHMTPEDMTALAYENLARMQDHFEEHQEQYQLDTTATFKEVKQKLVGAAEQFLEDYPEGLEDGRYRGDVLPDLHFDDATFDYCLSSHFLFATSELSETMHVQAIKEMARVAQEVRIFPLSNAFGEISPLLGPVMLALQQTHYGVEVKQVEYEFQRGSNAMLRIWATAIPKPNASEP